MKIRSRPQSTARQLGRGSLWLALLLILIAPGVTEAKIDLVTLPDRGEIELTIYNSADLTLVRERRLMSFSEGENELQFSWANTLIDPTSLRLEVLEGGDFLTVEDILYPPNTQNTIIWNVRADEAGKGRLEITYFTSGISWAADYALRANSNENKATLESYVKVVNNSGEDYEGATTRLLVGEINLEEEISKLARDQGMRFEEARQNVVASRIALAEEADRDGDNPFYAAPAPMSAGASMRKMEIKEVKKEGVGEYYLFTIGGTEDITDKLTKRLLSFTVPEIPIDVSYKLDPERFGPQIVKFYEFHNDEDHELGLAPLPGGQFMVFRNVEREDGANLLAFEGRYNERYVPVGEKLELNLGSDGQVLSEEKVMKFVRQNLSFSSYGDVNGYDNVYDYRLTLQSGKRKNVPVEIRRHIYEKDFDFDAARAQRNLWEKIDRDTYELKTDLEALSEMEFDFTVRVRTGANADQ